MKLLSIIMLSTVFQLSAIIWENDPSFSPEQREQARQNNERIRQRNQERQNAMQKELNRAARRYAEEVRAIKEKYQPLVG